MKRWSTLLPTNRSRRTAASLCPLFSHLMWRHVPVWASMQGSNAQFEMGPPCNGQSTRCAERDDTAHTGSDNSPSRKGRGFYGLTPMLCCPTASTLVAFNAAEGACAAAASRTSTTSKYARAFPRGNAGPRNRQTLLCWQGAYGQHSRDGARLRARRRSSPWLQPGAFSREEWVSRLAANMWKSVCLTPLQRCPDLWRYRTKTPKLRFCTLRNVGGSAAAHRTAAHARLITQWKACAESIGR
jgi:hypothetical protein